MVSKLVSAGHIAITASLLMLLAVFSFVGVSSGASGACPNKLSPGFRAYLPDCRAYELVSPEYREGYKVNIAGIAKDGSPLRTESFGSYSNPENTSGFGQSYRVVRSESGWESSPLDAPFSSLPSYAVQGMSLDFQSSIWFANVAGRFSRDVYLDPPSGPPVGVGPGAPSSARIGELQYVGASDDLHHVLFVDPSPSPEEENRLWPGDTTIGERRNSLYEYVGTGNVEPRLVGVGDTGRLISNCGVALGSLPEGDAYNAVSTTGSIVFFSAAACGGTPAVNELYARIGGEDTVAISEPTLPVPGRTCTGPCAAAAHQAAVYSGASRDGSRVFFMTTQPLVNEDIDNGSDLYEAEIQEGAVTRLAQISRGGEGDMTPGSGAGVLGVARVAEDGSRVYFVAEGVLTGANREEKSPVAGGPNLYVFTRECADGGTACGNPKEHTAFVATLSPLDEGDWSTEDRRPVQATASSGDFLVFQSRADLTSDEEGREEAGQVFEYDTGTGTLVRVSRGDKGYNENGNTNVFPAVIPVQDYEVSKPENRFTGLAVSADGSHVFFSSYDALTPQALGGFNNVYEYHGGEVSLISDGHDTISTETQPATRLIGTDESGRDAFFTTADRLVPQAGDTQIAVYDARSEGGFAPAAEHALCLNDSCQGGASEPPLLLAPATSLVAAEVNGSVSGAAPAKAKAKPKAKTKMRPKKRKKRLGKKRAGKKTARRGK